jgi:hypothetical protein
MLEETIDWAKGLGRVRGVKTVIAWINSQRRAPIMRETINKGSDKFFAEEEEDRRNLIDGIDEGIGSGLSDFGPH